MRKVLLLILVTLFAVNSAAKTYTPAEVEKRRKSRDLTIKLLLKSGKYVEQKIDEKNTLRPATPEETEKGYILFSRDYCENIYHNTVPTVNDTAKCVSFGSLGEYIPLTLSVYPLKDLKAAKISSAGLFMGKEKIGPENFEIRNAWHMPKRYRPGIFRVMPWMLEKKDTLDLTAGDQTMWGVVTVGPTRQWWITVKIPEDAKPGIYKGNIDFTPANSKASAVPVELEVLPIKLVSPKNFNMWFFDNPDINNDNYVKSLKEHGIYGNAPSMRVTVTAAGIDFEGFCKFVDLAQSKGLNSNFMIDGEPMAKDIATALKTTLYSDVFNKQGSAMVDKFNKQVKEKYKETVKFSYFGIDEPGNSEERQRALTPLLKWFKAIDGVLITESLNNAEMYKIYGKYTDIQMSYANNPELDRVFLADKGKVLTLNVFIGTGNVLHARLEPGLFPWRSNFGSLNIWSFQSFGGEPLNDLDGGDPDWCITGPCENDTSDFMPATEYEGVRKGVDDRRYVVTLEQFMEKAGKDPKLTAKVEGGRNILKELVSLIPDTRPGLGAAMNDKNSKLTNKKLEQIKRNIADKIIEIQDALK
ncbi:MAG: hypothetical protein WCK36_01550 [Candidatus Firestonebacteria bacterium]